ncbi:AlpA family transcriptional regulator [Thermomonas sp.]|uniref:helix-turn-helix transcriptional regulator n=1 Tax=Thermomonas sp. TaxID=1971895 RepID=UPI0024892D77|nr:AlpA family transcriptional regulator [Thermomonas sp.]MDI1254123.1 AlpA family transcriptional regulator [Thermomonas sp.]
MSQATKQAPMLADATSGDSLHLQSLRLLRLPEVKARTGYSRSEVYRRIAAGDFPAPVKLGERASAWPEHEINAWCQARIAARDAKAAT